MATYVAEDRNIKAEAASKAAEQISEIEERIALAYVELDSASILISQAHPRIPEVLDYIYRLSLSKARNVPWIWAYVINDRELPMVEAEVRSQMSLPNYSVVRSTERSSLLAPVILTTAPLDKQLLGADLVGQPALSSLFQPADISRSAPPAAPLVIITGKGYPPDTLFMIRQLPATAKSAGVQSRSSMILRGITAANLALSAKLEEGQLLRVVDRTVVPPRTLIETGGNTGGSRWLPEREFTTGQYSFGVSLTPPQATRRPLWWLLALVVGFLATAFYAALRSGLIVRERASRLGTILSSTEQELVETQRREATFFENAGTANCETDWATGKLLRVNDSLCKMFGYSREELVGRSFVDITHPEDIAPSRNQLVDGNGDPKPSLQFEKRYIRKDGSTMWGLVNARLYFDVAGKPKSYMTVIVNIDDRKRDEATTALLARELAHRVRNTVQLTSSLARQTAASAKTVRDYDTNFHRRLAALSAAQDILFDRNWVSASLLRIAQATIKPFLPEGGSQGRLTVDIADVELPTQQAQTIAIALHELASNSSKYGALSNQGTVSVVGRVVPDPETGKPVLHLQWDEQSTRVIRKPRKSGFGTRMLMSAMPEQFGGHAKATWRPKGYLYEAWLKLPDL